MLPGPCGFAAQMQQPAPLRLPAGQQITLQVCGRLRSETRQLVNAQRRLVETPGKQQRRRDQAHQLRRAQHQFITMLLMQAQQQHRVLLAEQVFKTEMLQQAYSHFVLFGLQRLLKRCLPVLGGGKPLARAPVPGAPRWPGFGAHQLGQWREDLQPVGGLFPGLDKGAQRLQVSQVVAAVTKAEQVVTQARVEAWQVREHAPGLGQFRRQAREQLVLQVVEQGFVRVPVAFKQSDTHSGAPAGAELQHLVGAGPGQVLDFAGVKRQLGSAAFPQLIIKQQPGPVAGRPPPRADPPGQGRAAGRQNAVKQPIQFRRRHAAEVIEKQPGRRLPAVQGQQQGGLINKVEAKALRQALTQIRGHAIQRQPVHLALRRRLQRALGEQCTLATAGRGAEQLHPRSGVEQRHGQARAQQMMGRQAWHESRTIQTTGHGGHYCVPVFYY